MKTTHEVIELLTPAEVATLYRVDPKTVTRWAKSGKIPEDAIVWTLGGHRRYVKSFMDEAFANFHGRRQ